MTKKLVILGAVLCLFLYTCWSFYSEGLSYDPLSAIAVKRPKTKVAGKTASTYSSAWSEEIIGKNLFSPSRGPKPPPPPQPPPPPPPPPVRPDLSLRGVALNASGEYTAFIEINKAPAVTMRKGDKLEDIEVADISERRVVLQWMGEKITLDMEKIKTLASPGAVKASTPGGVIRTGPAMRGRRRPGTPPGNMAPQPVPQPDNEEE